MIAGDFVSFVNGRVLHASAISLSVGRNETEVLLRVEDGAEPGIEVLDVLRELQKNKTLFDINHYYDLAGDKKMQ